MFTPIRALMLGKLNSLRRIIFRCWKLQSSTIRRNANPKTTPSVTRENMNAFRSWTNTQMRTWTHKLFSNALTRMTAMHIINMRTYIAENTDTCANSKKNGAIRNVHMFITDHHPVISDSGPQHQHQFVQRQRLLYDGNIIKDRRQLLQACCVSVCCVRPYRCSQHQTTRTCSVWRMCVCLFISSSQTVRRRLNMRFGHLHVHPASNHICANNDPWPDQRAN